MAQDDKDPIGDIMDAEHRWPTTKGPMAIQDAEANRAEILIDPAILRKLLICALTLKSQLDQPLDNSDNEIGSSPFSRMNVSI